MRFSLDVGREPRRYGFRVTGLKRRLARGVTGSGDSSADDAASNLSLFTIRYCNFPRFVHCCSVMKDLYFQVLSDSHYKLYSRTTLHLFRI
jgi:hypothetical protein